MHQGRNASLVSGQATAHTATMILVGVLSVAVSARAAEVPFAEHTVDGAFDGPSC